MLITLQHFRNLFNSDCNQIRHLFFFTERLSNIIIQEHHFRNIVAFFRAFRAT